MNRAEAQQISSEVPSFRGIHLLHLWGLFLIMCSAKQKNHTFILRIPSKTPEPIVAPLIRVLLHPKQHQTLTFFPITYIQSEQRRKRNCWRRCRRRVKVRVGESSTASITAGPTTVGLGIVAPKTW